MHSSDQGGGSQRPKETVSILIAPSRSGKTFQWTLSERVVRVGLVSGLAAVVLFLITLVLSGLWAVELVENRALGLENARLRVEFARLAELEGQVEDLSRLNRQMQVLLGVDTLSSGQASSDDASGESSMSSASSASGESQPSAAGPALTPGPWRATPPRIAPTQGLISRGYHEEMGTRSHHPGVDVPRPVGTPVVAAGGGIVRQSGDDPVYGKMVVIEHGGGLESVYGHASRLLVEAGDSVKAGQRIALVGNTGQSSAPHLHFEVRNNGRPVDPGLYVREYESR